MSDAYDDSPAGFLKRAELLLKDFDNSRRVEFLTYAALELRYGIEARVLEYVRYQMPGRVKDREYRVAIMRKALDDHGHGGSGASVSYGFYHDPQNPVERTWSYQGVDSTVVSIHGRLGDLLHASYFSARYLPGKTTPDTEFDQIRMRLGSHLDEIREFVCGGMRGPFDLKEAIAFWEHMIAHRDAHDDDG